MSDGDSFIIAGGFNSPTLLFDYFFWRGCEPSNIKAHQGPDGLWRGAGKITWADVSDWLDAMGAGSRPQGP